MYNGVEFPIYSLIDTLVNSGQGHGLEHFKDKALDESSHFVNYAISAKETVSL